MPVKSIVITENPVSAWEMYEQTLPVGRFKDPSATHRDQGGFWQAGFEYVPTSKNDALAMLNNGLGRNVVFYNEHGQINWEGFINTVVMNTGAASIKNSLNDMTNKVWTRYTPIGGGAVTRGTVIENAVSQARYGIKERPLSGGEISNTIADQLSQTYLNLNFWPRPQLDRLSLGKSTLGLPEIKISCHGYFRTLEWMVWNQTLVAGTQSASAQIQEIVEGGVAPFVKTAFYAANASVISREFDADRKASDIVQSIADVGNAEYRIFIVGMEEDRHFYYKESAPPVRE